MGLFHDPKHNRPLTFIEGFATMAGNDVVLIHQLKKDFFAFYGSENALELDRELSLCLSEVSSSLPMRQDIEVH
jgi:hypothetical protein